MVFVFVLKGFPCRNTSWLVDWQSRFAGSSAKTSPVDIQDAILLMLTASKTTLVFLGVG